MRLRVTTVLLCLAGATATTAKGQETTESIIRAFNQTVFATCSDGQETLVVGWQYLPGGELRGLGRLVGSDLRLDGDRLTAASQFGVWVFDSRKLVRVGDDDVQSYKCSLIGTDIQQVFYEIDWTAIAEQHEIAIEYEQEREHALEEREKQLRILERDIRDRELLISRREGEVATLRNELDENRRALKILDERSKAAERRAWDLAQALNAAVKELMAANKSVAVKSEWNKTLDERMRAAEARVRELESQ